MLRDVEDIAVVVVFAADADAVAAADAIAAAVVVVVTEARPKAVEDQNFLPIFSSVRDFLFQWKLASASDLRVQT